MPVCPVRQGSGSDLDWSWILGGAAEGGGWSADGDVYQMIYMLAGAGAVMLLIFLCCFYVVYRNFRVKTTKPQDNGSDSPPLSRASRRSSES